MTTTVLNLQVMVLPAIDAVMSQMVGDGVPDPVATLRRLQGGGDPSDAATLRYARLFRHLRGVYGFNGNEQILELAIRQAIDLAGSLR
jgi:hypothetical protein